MKQISSFMTEIGDEFKIVVVKAIRELCVKYPAKHRSMVRTHVLGLSIDSFLHGYHDLKHVYSQHFHFFLVSYCPVLTNSLLQHQIVFLEHSSTPRLLLLSHIASSLITYHLSPCQWIYIVKVGCSAVPSFSVDPHTNFLHIHSHQQQEQYHYLPLSFLFLFSFHSCIHLSNHYLVFNSSM